MRAEEREDIVWKALAETAEDVAPGVPIELLRKAYEIQRRYQFEQDNSESLRLMERLIEEQVGGDA